MNNTAYKTLLRDLGLYLHLPALLTVPSIAVVVVFEEWFALLPFGLMAATSLGVGQLLYWLFRRAGESTPPFSLLLVSSAWLMVAILGLIPFYGVALAASDASPASAVFLTPINAFFESMSGITGTGLTMVDDPSRLPHVLQWWRSLLEWVGGVGVVVLGMLILNLQHDDSKLYRAATRNWTITDEDTDTTVYRMWWIYFAYTLASVGGFYLAGMPAWEAINHGMTGISTGGFTITSDSFISYSPTIKAVGTVIMLVGALSFKIHYLLLFRRSPWQAWRQTQFRYFLLLLLLAAGIIVWLNPSVSVINNLFQVTSALGTCGFNSAPLQNGMMPVLFLLTIAMVLGGNGSSTTGGIKTQRVAWLTKALGWQVRKIWRQREENPVIYYNEEPVEEKEAQKQIIHTAMILSLWLGALGTGALSLAVMVGEQYAFHQILFDVASALGNVGLSAGVNGADLPVEAKFLLISLMWMGRLEIFAVLMLFSTPFRIWRKEKEGDEE